MRFRFSPKHKPSGGFHGCETSGRSKTSIARRTGRACGAAYLGCTQANALRSNDARRSFSTAWAAVWNWGEIYMSNDNLGKRILPVCAIHQDGKYWPFIRLQGRWLQRLGFEAGGMIEVEYSLGLLLIRLLPRTLREWTDEH